MFPSIPCDSSRDRFVTLFGGHNSNLSKGSRILTIPKGSQRIARNVLFSNKSLQRKLKKGTISSGHSGLFFGDPNSSPKWRVTFSSLKRSQHLKNIGLVGGFNPSEKYARQIGSFPQVRVKIKIFETTT